MTNTKLSLLTGREARGHMRNVRIHHSARYTLRILGLLLLTNSSIALMPTGLGTDCIYNGFARELLLRGRY
jgi:hypothetical protein